MHLVCTGGGVPDLLHTAQPGLKFASCERKAAGSGGAGHSEHEPVHPQAAPLVGGLGDAELHRPHDLARAAEICGCHELVCAVFGVLRPVVRLCGTLFINHEGGNPPFWPPTAHINSWLSEKSPPEPAHNKLANVCEEGDVLRTGSCICAANACSKSLGLGYPFDTNYVVPSKIQP